MLRVYVDATTIEPLERLLKSMQRQKMDIIKITVISNEISQLEEFKNKFDFEIIKIEKDIVSTLNQLIRKNDTDYFIIASSNQILGVNFAETVDGLVEKYDGLIFNISKIRTTGVFCDVYNKKCHTVYDAMKTRPVIQSGVFRTDIVNANNLVLKSFSLSGQINYLKKYFEYCENSYYCSEVLSYIDNLSETTKPSLGYVLRCDAYMKGVIKASINDILYSTLKKPFIRKFRKKIRNIIRKLKE